MITRDEKIKFVESSKKEIKNYKTVGIVTVSSVPDRLFQRVRNSIGSDGKFIIGRKKLMERVLEGDERTKPLIKELTATSVIILSNKDPFELYGIFKGNALKLSAKPKQMAPEDIIVRGGETSLQPGMAVTELKKAGIDVQIQKGKVVIAKDKVVVAKGAMISSAVASALHTLGIEPFTAVLEPKALIRDGLLFRLETLRITREGMLSDLSSAFAKSRAVALSLGIVTPYTVVELVTKAYRSAVALGTEAKIYDTGIIERLITKAAGEAHALEGLGAS
jgi:large subunit ribosomal protein L10